MFEGNHIERSKQTVAWFVLTFFIIILFRVSCVRLGPGMAGQASLSPTTRQRAACHDKANRPSVVRCIEAQTITKTMRVTAYCPCKKCCGRFADGITASGHKIRAGDKLCAAARSMPFGTQICIPGYAEGPVPVLDRGSYINNGRIDILFFDGDLESSHQKALEWGVRYLECKIYE